MYKFFEVITSGLAICFFFVAVSGVSASELSDAQLILTASVWENNDFMAPPVWERKKRIKKRVPRILREQQRYVPDNTYMQKRKRLHIKIHSCEDGIPQDVPDSIPRYIDNSEEKEIRLYIRDAYVGLYENGILICLMPAVTGGRETPTSDVAGLNVTQDQKVDYYSTKLYPGKHGRLVPAYMKYATRIGRPDKPVGTSGVFFHKGNMSSWRGRVVGKNPNPPTGSHGCIRLHEMHARFLYYWVHENTKVRVFVDFKKRQNMSQR